MLSFRVFTVLAITWLATFGYVLCSANTDSATYVLHLTIVVFVINLYNFYA